MVIHDKDVNWGHFSLSRQPQKAGADGPMILTDIYILFDTVKYVSVLQ